MATAYDQNQRRLKAKAYVEEFKKGKSCNHCGESNPITFDFHHINPETKTANLARLCSSGCNFAKIQTELDKCVILCRNCHAKVHISEDSIIKKIIKENNK